MSKINLKAMLHNITEDKYFSNEVKGIKTDNIVKFIDGDIVVVLELFEDKINLKRSSNEYNIYMTFKLDELTKGTYKINSLGSLDLDVKTTLIDIKDNIIEIEYQMIIDNSEVQKFNYKIEYEEM